MADMIREAIVQLVGDNWKFIAYVVGGIIAGGMALASLKRVLGWGFMASLRLGEQIATKIMQKPKALVLPAAGASLAIAAVLGNASVPRMEKEQAQLTARIVELEAGLEVAQSEKRSAEAAALDARRTASAAEGHAGMADGVIAQAERKAATLIAQAEARVSALADQIKAERRQFAALVSERDEKIRELQQKIPSSATQVRLAQGGLLGTSYQPNAKCPYCGVLLMIGELKEGEWNDSGTYVWKEVQCPKCNEMFSPDGARKDVIREYEARQPVRRRR